jgi:hypothetical protein
MGEQTIQLIQKGSMLFINRRNSNFQPLGQFNHAMLLSGSKAGCNSNQAPQTAFDPDQQIGKPCEVELCNDCQFFRQTP